MQNLRERMKSEMASKEFLEKAIRYSFEYIDNIETQNVFPSDDSMKLLSNFDEDFPNESQGGDKVIDMLHDYGSPTTVAQIGGRYFGFVNGGIIPTSLAAKWLVDTWDQNAAMFVTSPIASKLESVVEKWLIDIFGLPIETAIGLVGGTSTATFVGLATARNFVLKKLGWDVTAKGLFGAPEPRVIVCEEAHGTVFKALALLGLGKNRVEKIPADDQGRFDTTQLPELDHSCIIILQAGNVNTGAFDDFAGICSMANKVGAWIHIDGAFGLWAHGSKSKKELTNGIELADSWSVDGHKTLNTPYDCGIILCKHRDEMISTMQATGDYIQFSKQRDGMMYGPEMSRRARSVELWATLRYLGREGLEELVGGLCDLATSMAKQLREHDFQILNDVVFNQILVSGETEHDTKNTLSNLQKSGELWVGSTKWKCKTAIRVSICSWATTDIDVKRSVNAFLKARENI